MKKFAIFLFVLSLCLSGSEVFAIDPGLYNFGGTISIDSVFATGGTGQHSANGHGYFCIESLEVGEPDGNGVQQITSTIGAPTYGVYISGIRLPVVDCIQLDPIGQITGFIDNDGNQMDATVTTAATNCERLINYECAWETSIHAPVGDDGTVVMTIPLHSSVLQEQSPGDPAATSLRAIGSMENGSPPPGGGEYQLTIDFRDGVPLQERSYGVYSLDIVSPDAHFREWGGLLIEDVLSWTRFDGTFSRGSCPAQVPSWTDCSSIGPPDDPSGVLNYILILLLPALFISIGVIGRRK